METPSVIVIKSGGKIYRIPKAPFEPIAQTYERGWYLVSQSQSTQGSRSSQGKTPEEWFEESFKWLYKKQGMTYSEPVGSA